MLAPLLVALALLQPSQQEVITEIRIHGNVATPDAEVRRLAGIDTGVPFTADTPDTVARRLRATKRFERVEVLKRFASIEDATKIVLIVVVDEGPVKIEGFETPETPAQVIRRRGLDLMFLPILDFEDGYGFTYGVRFAKPNVAGKHSRVSFPLTWGGERRAAAEFSQNLTKGPFTILQAGASASRRTNPFFEQDDDRQGIWLRGERALTPSLRVGATGGWQHVSFEDNGDRFTHVGADVTLDTRLDPMLARNAVYARAGVEHLDIRSTGGVNRTTLDARGYVGLVGQNILVVRGLREDASQPLPPYLQSLLGGMSNLRGFRAGTAVGDTLVAGSAEVLAPITSPLSFGKFGVNGFVDIGTVYSKNQRLADQHFSQGIGGGVWLTAAFFRLNLVVAHGIGAGTRIHFGTAISF
jgi:outer membrane protein assembly factor BamA